MHSSFLPGPASASMYTLPGMGLGVRRPRDADSCGNPACCGKSKHGYIGFRYVIRNPSSATATADVEQSFCAWKGVTSFVLSAGPMCQQSPGLSQQCILLCACSRTTPVPLPLMHMGRGQAIGACLHEPATVLKKPGKSLGACFNCCSSEGESRPLSCRELQEAPSDPKASRRSKATRQLIAWAPW